MQGVGLCATFSRQGDWAFDYALDLARRNNTKLNIFQFLESPYTMRRDVVFVDAEKTKTEVVSDDLVAKKDKELRMQYDDKLGEFSDVGFRLCEGASEVELKKCFRRGDYEVLVIGYQERNADFGGTTTIEKFADKFNGPVVLIGPDDPNSFYINDKAKEMVDELNIPSGKWQLIAA
jgi:hypothetical protein